MILKGRITFFECGLPPCPVSHVLAPFAVPFSLLSSLLSSLPFSLTSSLLPLLPYSSSVRLDCDNKPAPVDFIHLAYGYLPLAWAANTASWGEFFLREVRQEEEGSRPHGERGSRHAVTGVVVFYEEFPYRHISWVFKILNV
jgi:hypothetical protein